MTANTNKPVNIPEFKVLIERYESITSQEVKETWSNQEDVLNSHTKGFHVANVLTGFGGSFSCRLCSSCLYKCYRCVYKIDTGCINISDALKKSYDRISEADSPLKLYNAFRNRAKVLRKYAEDNGIDINN